MKVEYIQGRENMFILYSLENDNVRGWTFPEDGSPHTWSIPSKTFEENIPSGHRAKLRNTFISPKELSYKKLMKQYIEVTL